LGNREALATSLRTTVIVRLGRIRAIVTVHKTLGSQHGNVQRTEAVIEELLAAQREAGVGFERGRVASVGRAVANPARSARAWLATLLGASNDSPAHPPLPNI